jgi:hypothetical protein
MNTTFDLARLPWGSRHVIREVIFKEESILSSDLIGWREVNKDTPAYKEMKNWNQAQKDLLAILQELSRD